MSNSRRNNASHCPLGSTLPAFVVATMAVASTASAATLNVPAAFATIQDAINAASPGDTVLVANGVYHERIDFLGKNIVVKGATPDNPALTVIDADLLGTAVTMNGVGAQAELVGFTILEGSGTFGGGLTLNGDAQIRKCHFIACQATNGGGALVAGDASFVDCDFINNHATGGAGLSISGNVSIDDCFFEMNDGTGGGAIEAEGNLTVTDCRFRNNDATVGSSVLFTEGLAGFDRCTFDDDQSTVVYTYASLVISNSVFADGGTAIRTHSGLNNLLVTLLNVTFHNDGLTNIDIGDYGFNTTLIVRNSILWSSTNTITVGGTGRGTESINVQYSNVEGGWPGTGNIDADPKFVDTASLDFRLDRGSPSIDAGNNAAVPGLLTLDRDGNPRRVNDPGTTDTGAGTAPIVDMGALETHDRARYVNHAAGGANDGTSWADAYVDLQDALDEAAASGEIDYILVAKGVYQPDRGTGDRTASFVLVDGTHVYGGFDGTENEISERDTDANVTTLSGAIGGPGNGDNSYHVVTAIGVGLMTQLEGMVIQKGFANGSVVDNNDRGAGIYMLSASPIIRDCWIRQNEAIGTGGGIYCINAAPGIADCRLNLNIAGSFGSAIACWGGLPIIANSLIHGNDVNGEGAISFLSNTIGFIVNSTIAENGATVGGCGGVYMGVGANVVVRNSLLWDNTGSFGSQQTKQLTSFGSLDIGATLLKGWTGAYGGTGNSGADPLFVDPLGPDLIPGTGDDNYQLQEASPAIDNAQSNFLDADYFLLDLAGANRFVDDLATPNSGLGSIAYLDRGCFEFQGSPCPNDLNGDGVTDAMDLAILLGAWGTSGPGDLNGSGSVEAADLAILLGAFGPC